MVTDREFIKLKRARNVGEARIIELLEKIELNTKK